MDVKKILDELLIENNYKSSVIMFETLILKVLNEFSEDNKEKFITNYRKKIIEQRRTFSFDAFAPDGFDTLQGGTIFEIKAYRNKNTLKSSRINEILNNILTMANSSDLNIKNVVFIISLDLTSKEKRQIIEKLENEKDLNIEVWDLKSLQNIFNNYPDLVSKTLENISELVLNNQLLESMNNQTNYKDKHISELKKYYFEDDLVLFLGAGISKDANIPMWDNLVTDLLVSLLSNKLEEFDMSFSKNDKDYIVESLKNSNGNSPLLLARYIRQGLQDTFSKILAEILYKSCIDESKVLTAITKLCKPVRNGTGVRGVVNYNFDDLLEYNFKKHDINHRAIYREGDIPTRDELAIYHVHGFLPRERDDYDNLTKSLLVFSEEGYHNLMLDPYSWSNLVQLNYLRENSCLFIGLSLRDPNLRRLLDIASRKQESDTNKHYAILERELYHSKTITDQLVNVENIQKFDSANLKLQEEYYNELGLDIIWVNSYDEIPEILHKIRQ